MAQEVLSKSDARLIIWDLEIEKSLDDMPGETQEEQWDAVRQGDAGISCLVLFDSQTQRYHLYDKHTLNEAVDHLNSADLLIGFNTISFDSEVIHGVTGRYITVAQYDILHEIWKALGGRRKGWRLNDISKRLFGLEKTESGAGAPTLAKQGRWAELMDYCLNDVHLTRLLFNHVVAKESIPDKDGEEVFLARPWYEEAI